MIASTTGPINTFSLVNTWYRATAEFTWYFCLPQTCRGQEAGCRVFPWQWCGKKLLMWLRRRFLHFHSCYCMVVRVVGVRPSDGPRRQLVSARHQVRGSRAATLLGPCWWLPFLIVPRFDSVWHRSEGMIFSNYVPSAGPLLIHRGQASEGGQIGFGGERWAAMLFLCQQNAVPRLPAVRTPLADSGAKLLWDAPSVQQG